MYKVEFYETKDGESQIWDFLEELRIKAATSKNERIQFKQASLYIELLQKKGTHLNENITKYLEDDIWELRPGNNRIFYFSSTTILLFCFINSAKNRRRPQGVKLKKQKESEMTIYLERRR